MRIRKIMDADECDTYLKSSRSFSANGQTKSHICRVEVEASPLRKRFDLRLISQRV